MDKRIGYNRLWNWFGLSRASWLTIPRVLMHEMPDEWQNKMAKLLEEYDKTWNFENIDLSTYVTARKDNRFVKFPDWILQYRHPNYKAIEEIKSLSQKSSKKLRRAIRKESDKIKIEGLDEFIKYASSQKLKRRLAFALRIIFKSFRNVKI